MRFPVGLCDGQIGSPLRCDIGKAGGFELESGDSPCVADVGRIFDERQWCNTGVHRHLKCDRGRLPGSQPAAAGAIATGTGAELKLHGTCAAEKLRLIAVRGVGFAANIHAGCDVQGTGLVGRVGRDRIFQKHVDRTVKRSGTVGDNHRVREHVTSDHLATILVLDTLHDRNLRGKNFDGAGHYAGVIGFAAGCHRDRGRRGPVFDDAIGRDEVGIVAELIDVVGVFCGDQCAAIRDRAIEEITGWVGGIRERPPVKCDAVSGLLEVALIGNKAQRGLHQARRRCLKSGNGDIHRGVARGFRRHGAVAIKDGEISRGITRCAIGHDERPSGVHVCDIFPGLHVGYGVGAVAGGRHESRYVLKALVVVAAGADDRAGERLIRSARGHELDGGPQGRRGIERGAACASSPVETCKKHLGSSRHDQIRPAGVERSGVAIGVDIRHQEVVVGHLAADAVLGIDGGRVAGRRSHERVGCECDVPGVVGLIPHRERRRNGQRPPWLELLCVQSGCL